MSLGAALVASFLVTLVRPATWALALAAFLVRGGVLLVLAPIIVVPSAVGMANVFAPFITRAVFEGVTPSLVIWIGGIAAGTIAWLVIGGFLAALAEAELITTVAADEDVAAASSAAGSPPGAAPDEGSARSVRGSAWRILACRLVAAIPLVLALAWGTTRIVSVAYRELTVPSDVATPLVIRVVSGAPEAIVVIVLAWLVGETVGAVAARRVVLGREPVGRALLGAVGRVVRHPLRAAVLTVVPLVALVAVAIPSAAAASTTWDAVRASLATGRGALVSTSILVLFVGLWLGGLVLIAVASAWRAAAWTVEVAGTFGAPVHDPEGDWNPAPESGTLTDLRPRGVDPDAR